jgi:hypothetical protein
LSGKDEMQIIIFDYSKRKVEVKRKRDRITLSQPFPPKEKGVNYISLKVKSMKNFYPDI